MDAALIGLAWFIAIINILALVVMVAAVSADDPSNIAGWVEKHGSIVGSNGG